MLVLNGLLEISGDDTCEVIFEDKNQDLGARIPIQFGSIPILTNLFRCILWELILRLGTERSKHHLWFPQIECIHAREYLYHS